MKLIKAIVRPNKVDEVKDALAKLNVAGMTVTEVRGHGKQKGHTAIYRGKEYNVSLLPKMEIEVVVPDEIVDDAVKAIMQAARTGEIGDGRVFVLPVGQSYRIRTGELERGLNAQGRDAPTRGLRGVGVFAHATALPRAASMSQRSSMVPNRSVVSRNRAARTYWIGVHADPEFGRDTNRQANTMVRKLCAGALIVLGFLPFTAPFSTLDTSDLDAPKRQPPTAGLASVPIEKDDLPARSYRRC